MRWLVCTTPCGGVTAFECAQAVREDWMPFANEAFRKALHKIRKLDVRRVCATWLLPSEMTTCVHATRRVIA